MAATAWMLPLVVYLAPQRVDRMVVKMVGGSVGRLVDLMDEMRVVHSVCPRVGTMVDCWADV